LSATACKRETSCPRFFPDVFKRTAEPVITFTMREVLRNQKLLGSTMGSLKDLKEATQFLADHKIVPYVGHVFQGFEKADEAFELMKQGNQFGKIVIQMGADAERAKL
jgi:D-arabinose 1-dehydrogenase-like Zn-dependent alcohol dehydrogenase